MPVIYFTSDLHFAHPYVAATRGFIDDDIVWRLKTQDARAQYIKALVISLGDAEFEKRCNVDKHDRKIINNINAYVGKKDELYILGDLSIGSSYGFEQAMHRLDDLYVPRCHRHLVLGNHEAFKLNENQMKLAASRFATISNFELLNVGDAMVAMTHLPDLRCYGSYSCNQIRSRTKFGDNLILFPSDENVYMLHGHTHSDSWNDFKNMKRRINVGLDAWGLKPVSFDKIKNLPFYG